MDNSTSQQELVMKYLDGLMGEEEKAVFEMQLSGSPELQDELENLRIARYAVISYGLKEQVAGIHREMMLELHPATPVKKLNHTRRIIRYSVAVAASVLLVFLGIEGYDFYRLSPERLYSEKFTAYEPITLRDEDTGTLSATEKAYREKNYEEVIRLNSSTEQSRSDIFLTGQAFLQTNEPAKAISSFQVVLADIAAGENAILKDAAEYYLALSYLKNRDFDQAIELMTSIKDNPFHLYKMKFSRRFINRVKRLK